MRRKWNEIANEQFNHMPKSFRDDWADLRKKVMDRV